MADITKTVSVLFQGTDDISDTIKRMGRNIDAFGDDIGDIGAPFADIAEKVLILDAALVALAAGGLLYAFNASSDFENSVIELKKVLGEGAGVDQAIEEATRLSEVYGESAESILLSVADFKQAGFSISEALSLTVNALDLVIAGNIDAARSSDLIVAALKGFGAEADQAGRFIDILNEVSNNYATDVEQLAIGMSKLSPIAKTMGFSMEEAAGLLVPVIEIFRSGDEAAVALKTGLLKLIDDSKPVAEGLAAIGVAQFDANGEFRSGREIYLDVATAFQTMDKEQKLFITQQLVGIQQSARMVTVFDNLALANEITATAMGSAGSAAKEVAERLKAAEISVKIFEVSFDNLARTVGDQFRLAAQEAISGGADISQALRGIVEAGTFDGIFDNLNDFANDLGEFLSLIAKNLPEAFENIDFSGLLDAFGDVGDSLKGVFDGIDLTSPEGLQKAIQAIIDALESLARTSSGIISAMTMISDAIITMITAFNKLDPDTKELTGNILGFGVALVTLGGVLKIGGALLSGLSTLTGFFSGGGILYTSILAMVTLLSGPAGLVVGLAAVATAVASYSMGSIEKEHLKVMAALEAQDDAARVLLDDLDRISTSTATAEVFVLIEEGDLDGARVKIDELTEQDKTARVLVETEQDELNTFFDAYNGIDPEKEVAITAAINAGDFELVNAILEGMVDEKQITVTADVKQATETLTFWTETQGAISIEVPVSAEGLEDVTKDIEKIPTEKQVEIKLKGEIDTKIAQIAASAKTAQSAFEWTAKVDIAQVQAAAEMSVAAFDAIGDSVVALAGSTSDMFGAVVGQWDKLSQFDQNVLMRNVTAQQDAQNKALDSQIALNEAQTEYLTARTEASREGEAAITIDSSGLEPALEMIMFEIIQKVQIRATENASEFLLGV